MDSARKMLEIEGNAVLQASKCINESFQEAINILNNHKGKIIICGMGKSGHICRKIAATLMSIGKPTVFLHPSEAVHGDLGIYTAGDPTILLSKSGTTDELLCLAPVLKRFNSKIISIVGNPDSPLAKKSDVVIDISFAHEGDPLGIIPSTSSLVSLAIGDAIAAALMNLSGFQKSDFAKLHPAGQLGRNLNLHVSDVMIGLMSCAKCGISTGMREVIVDMTTYPNGAALVVDEGNHLLGIITDGDVRRAIQNHSSFENLTAKEIMTASPKLTFTNSLLGDALSIMESGKSQIAVLPVVNNKDSNTVIGLLRLHDAYHHG